MYVTGRLRDDGLSVVRMNQAGEPFGNATNEGKCNATRAAMGNDQNG